tara:strand:+ start:86542 stop:86877 length:336 start_codon:yes stop_codon:yes gene_type:complete
MNIVEVLHKVGGRIMTPFKQSIIFCESDIDAYMESMEADDEFVNVSNTHVKSPVSQQYLLRADFNRYMDKYNAAYGDGGGDGGGDVRNKFLENALKFEGEFVYFEGEIVTI